MKESESIELSIKEQVIPELRFVSSEIQEIRRVIMDSSKELGRIKRENNITSSLEQAIEECFCRLEILFRLDSIGKRIIELEKNI